MSHGAALNINIEEVLQAAPIKPEASLRRLMWFFVLLGLAAYIGAFSWGYPEDLLWGAYYSNLIFWTGLAAGGVITAAIFQIVRAKWSPPVRRVAEANVAFLPWAWFLFLATWFGRQELFVWGRGPMPGREWWMQPGFVYCRFAILFFLLFYMMWRYVRMSLRSDIGFLRERPASRSRWSSWIHQYIGRNWRGSDREILDLQRKMSWHAPLLVLMYVVIFSLFSFEMVMGMNPSWTSNLFGAFEFIGNIYTAWAVTALFVIYFVSRNSDYAKTVTTNQLWDLGKLTFGFCMMWGYMFFSQFLAQWYGNLPEETQWLIIRTRIEPWKCLGWVTFSMCFVVPFILLLSEDLKRTPKAFAAVCIIVVLGVALERYMIVMPELSPDRIPLSFGEVFMQVSIFLGFMGAYVLSILNFIGKFPFVPVSHPLTHGSKEW